MTSADLPEILTAALRAGASDVHIDPQPGGARIRFRVDGILRPAMEIGMMETRHLIRRIKLFGGMDQNAVERPQDGAGRFHFGGFEYDIRCAVTVARDYREAAVLRIFDPQIASLEALGFDLCERGFFSDWEKAGSGMLVVSGATGSGKTSTLYAVAAGLATPDRAVVTIEDPVERRLPGARQIDVGGMDGATFARAFRSVLRQDPDIILLGEIRDAESARAAVDAALSGHPVLTTLHAAGAEGILRRLQFSFGIDASSIAHTVRLCVAQRLVGRPCASCRGVAGPECEACGGTGIRGRTVVAEMMECSLRDGELRRDRSRSFEDSLAAKFR